jgi:hypothetical protein
MHLWLKALTISLTLWAVSCDGDDCAKTLDTFASCILSIKKDKDVQDLMNKKLDIIKDCGAKDESIKCFKSKNECQGKAEDKASNSSERKDSLKDAAKCWTSEQTKNPFNGLDDVFHGLNFFGPDGMHHGPPPPGGDDNGPPPPPGAESIDDGPPHPPHGKGDDDGPPPKDGPPHKGGPPHFMPPDPFMEPDECMAAHHDKKVMNCTISKIIENASLGKIIAAMKDKLKQCKLAVSKECHPRGPGIFGCLMKAYKPTFTVAVSTYKSCMDKAGFKVPDSPMPKIGDDKGPTGSTPSSTTDHDHDHDKDHDKDHDHDHDKDHDHDHD